MYLNFALMYKEILQSIGFFYLYYISLRSLRLCNTCICLVKKKYLAQD